jgi:hypothetical protein
VGFSMHWHLFPGRFGGSIRQFCARVWQLKGLIYLSINAYSMYFCKNIYKRIFYINKIF